MTTDLPPGAVVGEYIIQRKLKAGGMGTVYEAVHPIIHKRAAVKVLKRELCENDEALHRFVQEARAVNQIDHPNIVDVFGFGVTDDGRSFLAMELLVGQTLGERVEQQPLSRADTCEVLLEITEALEAAHARGIVHRDLKPENVFLAETRGGAVVKLLDFGIAKLTGGGGIQGPVDVTQPGTVIGTPKYIAPEQARGLPIDGSADVYALGVIAFELLTGRAPFLASDPVELIAKHITLKPPAVRELAPDLPPVADVLVGEMLEKVPAARPSLARVRTLVNELRVAASGTPGAQVPRRPVTTIVSAISGTQVAALAAAPRARRRWWLAIPLGLGLIAIGVRVAVAVLERDGEVSGPASESPVVPVTPAAPAPTAPPAPTAAPAPAPIVEPIAPPPPAPVPLPPPPPISKKPTKHVPRPRPSAAASGSAAKPLDVPGPGSASPQDPDALRDPFHHP